MIESQLTYIDCAVKTKSIDEVQNYLRNWVGRLQYIVLTTNPQGHRSKRLIAEETRKYLESLNSGFKGYNNYTLSELFDRFYELEDFHKFIFDDLEELNNILNKVTYWQEYTGSLAF